MKLKNGFTVEYNSESVKVYVGSDGKNPIYAYADDDSLTKVPTKTYHYYYMGTLCCAHGIDAARESLFNIMTNYKFADIVIKEIKTWNKFVPNAKKNLDGHCEKLLNLITPVTVRSAFTTSEFAEIDISRWEICKSTPKEVQDAYKDEFAEALKIINEKWKTFKEEIKKGAVYNND